MTEDDDEPSKEIEAAWAAEIERRARRVLAGQGEFEDWETIREQLRPAASPAGSR